jgi:hypothetical protein
MIDSKTHWTLVLLLLAEHVDPIVPLEMDHLSVLPANQITQFTTTLAMTLDIHVVHDKLNL